MCQCTIPSPFVGFQMNFSTKLAPLTTVVFRCFEPRNSVVLNPEIPLFWTQKFRCFEPRNSVALNPEKELVHEVFAKSDMENQRECQFYREKKSQKWRKKRPKLLLKKFVWERNWNCSLWYTKRHASAIINTEEFVLFSATSMRSSIQNWIIQRWWGTIVWPSCPIASRVSDSIVWLLRMKRMATRVVRVSPSFSPTHWSLVWIGSKIRRVS